MKQEVLLQDYELYRCFVQKYMNAVRYLMKNVKSLMKFSYYLFIIIFLCMFHLAPQNIHIMWTNQKSITTQYIVLNLLSVKFIFPLKGKNELFYLTTLNTFFIVVIHF